MVRAAIDEIDGTLGEVLARSPIIDSAPVGPSQRRYANAAIALESRLSPLEMLRSLQAIERALGRRRQGRRWRARVIDCDIVLWSGGVYAHRDLAIPHPHFTSRDFVLGPAAAIAPGWRDPVTWLTLRQLHARLTGGRPVPR